MLRKLLLAFGVLVASGWTACAAPLEAYGKLPNIEQLALSPSGALTAYIATDGDDRSVVVQTTADHRTTFMGHAGKAKLRNLVWVGDDHLIMTFSTARRGVLSGPKVESMLAEHINLKTGQAHDLLDHVKNTDTIDVIAGTPQVRTFKGKPTLFVYAGYFDGGAGGLGIFQINLDDNSATLIEKIGETVCDLLMGDDGEAVAMASCNDRASLWTLKVRSSIGGWRSVQHVTAPIDTPDLVGVASDGKSIVVDFGDETTGHSWRQLDLASGAWGTKAQASGS